MPPSPKPALTCMGSSGGDPAPKGFAGEAVSGLGARLPSDSFCGSGSATTLAASRVCAAGAQSAGLLGLVGEAASGLGAKLLSEGWLPGCACAVMAPQARASGGGFLSRRPLPSLDQARSEGS